MACHGNHIPNGPWGCLRMLGMGTPPSGMVYIGLSHGSLNVPIEHHPTIRYMVYNGYYSVMSNIPKMGQLPTPVSSITPVKSDYFVGVCNTLRQD